MNNKRLIFITILFFILVNTFYCWQIIFGVGAFIPYIILVIIFFGLIVALIRQLYFAFNEKFKNKNRFPSLIVLPIILLLSYLYPNGIIDFEKFESKDLLVAYVEEAASCSSTIKLKDNGEFREANICFGFNEEKGRYEIKNDTIYFDYYNKTLSEIDSYEFAIIDSNLILFKKNDTIKYNFQIIKNDIKTSN